MDAHLEGQEQGVGVLPAAEGKYLTFTLAGEEYGIGILKVKEIIGMMTITTVPQAPPFIRGVINLRGKVIPIVDLRSLFSLEQAGDADKTCIVVVEVGNGEGNVRMGVVVDSVSEVMNIKAGDIEETPSFGTVWDNECILGMAKIESGVKILLDIDRVVRSGEAARSHTGPGSDRWGIPGVSHEEKRVV